MRSEKSRRGKRRRQRGDENKLFDMSMKMSAREKGEIECERNKKERENTDIKLNSLLHSRWKRDNERERQRNRETQRHRETEREIE